ncbi:metal-sulfur cluster assembly factor [Candidatus Woesearchaeota archaeon]|nr:metal-sulfur cluster assembly factor [Candidatus Woesearchaeota archaeon]
MATKDDVVEAAKSCQDPELGIDIWTLGLIYDIAVGDDGTSAGIKMTFTSPLCPYGPQMVEEFKKKLGERGITPTIEIVFSPPWQPSEEVKEMLGMG